MAGETTGPELVTGSLGAIAFAGLLWVWGEYVVRRRFVPERSQRFARLWNVIICGGLAGIAAVVLLVGIVATITGATFR